MENMIGLIIIIKLRACLLSNDFFLSHKEGIQSLLVWMDTKKDCWGLWKKFKVSNTYYSD